MEERILEDEEICEENNNEFKCFHMEDISMLALQKWKGIEVQKSTEINRNYIIKVLQQLDP